jgi:hypothetical protein
MKVFDLKLYMEAQVVFKYVVNQFHTQAPDNCCAVLLGSNGRSLREVGSLQFQFLVRSSDPELAEKIAFEIHGHFNNKSDFVIGDTKIVMTIGQTTVPLYTGVDEKNRTIYSVNINAIVDNK